MAHHHITHNFSDEDIAQLNNCLGMILANISLDTQRVACQLTDRVLSCNSYDGGAYLIFQLLTKQKGRATDHILRLEFLPQNWSIFGEYALVKTSWLQLKPQEKDDWLRNNQKSTSFSLSNKMTAIAEWRIYGTQVQGQRDDDDEYGGDTFDVDLDLLLAFLGENGTVFCCSFHRYPELNSGMYIASYSSLNAFEETMSYGENYYGEKIFSLKRSGRL